MWRRLLILGKNRESRGGKASPRKETALSFMKKKSVSQGEEERETAFRKEKMQPQTGKGTLSWMCG